MKFVQISETTVKWILEEGDNLIRYGLEGLDGDDAIVDLVRPDHPLYRYVASTLMFIRSFVGIIRNVPMITEE